MPKDKEISLDQMAGYPNHLTMGQDVVLLDVKRPFENLTFPLRFHSLMVAMILKGECNIAIDLKNYHLCPRSLVVVHPRNYIYSAETSDDCEMVVMAVSQEVLEQILPKLTDLMPLLMHHRSQPAVQLSKEDADGLMDFCNFLRSQLERTPTPFLRQKIICLLQATLFELMDMQCRREQIQTQKKTRKEEIMAKFILLVSEHFRTERQLTFYAKQLCISAKHLSAVVKEISGHTAGEWIENYVTVEAKVLLQTTDMTIQELAQKLNFSNQSFFGKYFKHQTGMSPTEYRKLKS